MVVIDVFRARGRAPQGTVTSACRMGHAEAELPRALPGLPASE
jgi:hypothetical protein